MNNNRTSLIYILIANLFFIAYIFKGDFFLIILSLLWIGASIIAIILEGKINRTSTQIEMLKLKNISLHLENIGFLLEKMAFSKKELKKLYAERDKAEQERQEKIKELRKRMRK